MTIRFSYAADIDQPIDRVFAAVTDIAGLPRWSNVRQVRNLSPGLLKVGSTFQLIAQLGGEDRVVDCRVTALEPPRRFAYRWASEVEIEPTERKSTLVEFTLDPTGDGTRLRVVESGFDQLDASDDQVRSQFDDNSEGWEIQLGRVRDEAERVTA